ncbi:MULTISPECIES: hypothetical protein [unclassified Haematobacter]|uniref:hypothetical protein n=1 Tax=unclassified Haematobacter TaxID=2640585 RepID=UPI0025B7E35D|nr:MULTISPECIES: hypothetical protein [unclassified Haematobacter]
MRNRRWSDNDKYFGPFTYAKDGLYPFGLVATSTGEEGDPGFARVHVARRTILFPLPSWLIRPYREKVTAKYWSAEDIQRTGRNWYWQIDQRQFGFVVTEGALHVHMGRTTHDSDTDRSRVFFFPWREWRQVRHSLYDTTGAHFADLPKDYGPDRWAIEASCPTISFRFRDFDDEEIIATTKVEERQWTRGAGRFRWLSWFCPDLVRRILDLQFSTEVGERKGSWKGGTIRHSIEMLPDELHEAAFRRYCLQEGLTFVGAASQKEGSDG